MSEVDTIAELGNALVFSTDTNHLQVVAYLQAQRADESLACIACSTPAGITAVDVNLIGAIRQVEVAIRMTRTLAVEFATFSLLMVAFSSNKAIIDIIHIAFTVLLLATIAIFNVFINGARS